MCELFDGGLDRFFEGGLWERTWGTEPFKAGQSSMTSKIRAFSSLSSAIWRDSCTVPAWTRLERFCSRCSVGASSKTQIPFGSGKQGNLDLREISVAGGKMHVHSHPTNFNAVDLSSTRAAEKAASAQRAADVRGQLMRGDLDVEEEGNSFESFMVGRESEGNSQQQGRNQRNPAVRPQPADDEQAEEPLSFWA